MLLHMGGRHGEQIDSQTHVHVRMHTHAYTHKHTHMCVHTHTHTHLHPHKCSHICISTPPPTPHTHTHTLPHTHTYTHTQWMYACLQLGYITGHICAVTTGGVGCWATCRRSCAASPCTSSFTPKTCRWLPWVTTEVGTAAVRDGVTAFLM